MIKTDISKMVESPSHHAYLIIGDVEKNYEELRLAVRDQVVKKKLEGQDIWSRKFENLNIDDAREIKEVQSTLSIGKRRIVLFSLQNIQHEAQNSLLKLFEDPQSDTVSFVCAVNTEIFLPTVLSRFNIVQTGTSENGENAKLVSDFLSGTIKKRFELVESIIKDKDKAQAEVFLNDLEASLRGKINTPEVFENIFAARRYLHSRAPSVKMILENLCGIVPVVSGVKK